MLGSGNRWMGFDSRSTDELVRIAAAGGGFILDASRRPTGDLIRLATAAALKGARITLRGIEQRHTDELVSIGAAGKGNIVFEAGKGESD